MGIWSWICENDFSDNDQVLLEIYHYTNNLLGWAQKECKIKRKITNYFPVVAHIFQILAYIL